MTSVRLQEADKVGKFALDAVVADRGKQMPGVVERGETEERAGRFKRDQDLSGLPALDGADIDPQHLGDIALGTEALAHLMIFCGCNHHGIIKALCQRRQGFVSCLVEAADRVPAERSFASKDRADLDHLAQLMLGEFRAGLLLGEGQASVGSEDLAVIGVNVECHLVILQASLTRERR